MTLASGGSTCLESPHMKSRDRQISGSRIGWSTKIVSRQLEMYRESLSPKNKDQSTKLQQQQKRNDILVVAMCICAYIS